MTSWPRYCTICLTSMCNARCRHCSSGAGRKRETDVTHDQITALISELAAGGTFMVGLSGGEPLLLPWIFDVIGWAKKAGLITGIGTNGLVVTATIADRLVESNVDHVQVSLDGISRTHDELRGVPGLFDKAVRAIEVMLAKGLTVNVCMTVCKTNHQEMEQVIKLAIDLGVQTFNLSQFVPVGRGTSALDMPPGAWKEVLERLWNAKARFPGMRFTCHESQVVLVDDSVTRSLSFSGCQAGRGVACVRSDGAILPCVMLDLPVGNIRTESFARCWSSSSILRSLRDRSLLEGRCGVCDRAPWCGGCRGVAYAHAGNPLAEDPRCWAELA